MIAETPPEEEDRMAKAAERAAGRRKAAEENPEPSLGTRLGQIGILGWTIVVPILLGLFIGRWVDHALHTRFFFTAPLIMLGAAFGLWSAWKWMQRP